MSFFEQAAPIIAGFYLNVNKVIDVSPLHISDKKSPSQYQKFLSTSPAPTWTKKEYE